MANTKKETPAAYRRRMKAHGTVRRTQPALSALVVGSLDHAADGPLMSYIGEDGVGWGVVDHHACACGYFVCSQRGPCAPAGVVRCATCLRPSTECKFGCAPAAPKPSAPAAAVDPYVAAGHPWARVGMRVRCIDAEPPLRDGAEYTVVSPCPAHVDNGTRRFVSVDTGRVAGWLNERFEPVEPMPAAEWTSEACVWMRLPAIGRASYKHASGGNVWKNDGESFYRWATTWPGMCEAADAKPTLAQACCAALGIEVVCDDGIWLAWHGGNAFDTGAIKDAESCARLALQRYHQRGGKP